MKKGLKVNRHGDRNFDEKYFAPYYKSYTKTELLKAYRWFKGWIKFIGRYVSLEDIQGKRVLEVGCGIGAFAKILNEKGYRVKASDISAFIIDKAQKLQPGIEFVSEDVEKTIGKKEEFDIIFALEVFEHLNNPEMALKNLRGRLKIDGLLIFSSPYPTRRTLEDPTHISVRSPDEWMQLGKESGFKKMRFQYVSFLPFFYRYHSIFSWAFSVKTNLPIIVNTCFFYFEK